MANRGMPSMMALLGLLAVAGYQNRDKIGAALNNLGGGQAGAGGTGAGLPGGIGQLLSGLGAGGLSGGLSDLLNTFKNAGHADVADSWIRPGVPTLGLTPDQVEHAIGNVNLLQLSEQTGLTRDELLKRLATSIPATVDRLTPDGQMPTEEQARQNLGLPA